MRTRDEGAYNQTQAQTNRKDYCLQARRKRSHAAGRITVDAATPNGTDVPRTSKKKSQANSRCGDALARMNDYRQTKTQAGANHGKCRAHNSARKHSSWKGYAHFHCMQIIE